MHIAAGNRILDAKAVQRKLRRMAFQIAENNEGESSIIVAGIAGNGAVVAQNLVQQLHQIMQVPVALLTIHLNKKSPREVSVHPHTDFNDSNIVVVDDVANTGRTMLYALKPFLEYYPRRIQTLVLVERSHKLFSIQPDYVGLSITTTLQEHITVEAEGGAITGAWLH